MTGSPRPCDRKRKCGWQHRGERVRLAAQGSGVAGGTRVGRRELCSRRSERFSLLLPQSAHWFERLGLVTASARTFHTRLSGDRSLHRRTRALRAGRARPGRGAAEPPRPHLRSPLCSWRTGWRGEPRSLPCTHVPAQVHEFLGCQRCGPVLTLCARGALRRVHPAGAHHAGAHPVGPHPAEAHPASSFRLRPVPPPVLPGLMQGVGLFSAPTSLPCLHQKTGRSWCGGHDEAGRMAQGERLLLPPQQQIAPHGTGPPSWEWQPQPPWFRGPGLTQRCWGGRVCHSEKGQRRSSGTGRGGEPDKGPRSQHHPGNSDASGQSLAAAVPLGSFAERPSAAHCGACARKLGAACEAERLSGPARSARPGPAARLCPPAGLALRSWPVPARWARSQAVGQSRGPWVCKYHRPRVFCVGGGARAGAVGLGAAVWTPRAQPPSCLLPELGRGGARAAARGED
ncbi:uncharacterized protein LOC123951557 [Meles meles]|uniref:uncharacterized protein LOC123951557 n=1 Tax=Meles meles TaxID=9662 RepID=UPI001E69FA1C|nr:uncharacterized protein LOC123951557 [Meles meles]